jgi:DnaD/phage-associated family protein
MELVPVPGAVFGTLLREIDDLAELKTLLHVLRLLHQQPRPPRFVRRASLLADAGLLDALLASARAEADEMTGDAAVSAALDLAVARGTLLAVPVADGATEDVCYLLNTSANQRIVRQVLAGERSLGELGPIPTPREATQPDIRPTIYELYEQNIGLLTPLLAEELREAETSFPTAWIEDAFREAVAQNKRNWRYVRRILENWTAHGRGTSGATWRRPETAQAPGDYLETRYGRLVPR